MAAAATAAAAAHVLDTEPSPRNYGVPAQISNCPAYGSAKDCVDGHAISHLVCHTVVTTKQYELKITNINKYLKLLLRKIVYADLIFQIPISLPILTFRVYKNRISFPQ